MRRFLIPLLLGLAGLLAAARLVPAEQVAVEETLAGFPNADSFTHLLRPVILGILCMLPALAGLFYALAGTLARYVTRQFLSLFLICFAGLAVIWLLIDFQDNLQELRSARSPVATAARLYAARLPEMIVILLPYALLLSLLFTLGRLSSSREIIAMFQTGRGLTRVTTPFLLAGLFAAVLSAGLNFHWAPRATAMEKVILDSARGLSETAAENVQFRNPRVRRLWMVGAFPAGFQDGAPMKNIRIIRENDDATLRSILEAPTASWSRQTGAWSFPAATLREFTRGQPPLFRTDLPDPYVVRGWRETPAEIIQPGLPAEQLGIPGLRTWLDVHPDGSRESRKAHLTQWHHRWAHPLNCIIVILLATPLGIVFSRRGASGGVAIAVFLCAAMLFSTTVSLSLGDAGKLPPAFAAWLPNLLFGSLAIYLFHRRLSGRPIYQNLRRLIPNED